MGVRAWAAGAAIACGIGTNAAVAATFIVPFENLPDNGVPIQLHRPGYYGFNWGDIYYWESSYLLLNQRGNPELSGPSCNYIYCGTGGVPVFPPTGGNFVGQIRGAAVIESPWQNSFVSAWFTLQEGYRGPLSIKGYNGSVLVATIVQDLAVNTPTKIDLSALVDVTRVVFEADGGAAYVAIDALQFDTTFIGGAVPEPSTWAMMLMGFAGLGLVSKRRSRSISQIA